MSIGRTMRMRDSWWIYRVLHHARMRRADAERERDATDRAAAAVEVVFSKISDIYGWQPRVSVWARRGDMRVAMDRTTATVLVALTMEREELKAERDRLKAQLDDAKEDAAKLRARLETAEASPAPKTDGLADAVATLLAASAASGSDAVAPPVRDRIAERDDDWGR